jgi:hypothetical protein
MVVIYGAGTIISYDISTGEITDLHDFGNGNDADGRSPLGSLMQASNGLLYGITWLGGVNTSGIIFSYNIETDSEIILHNFGTVMMDNTLMVRSSRQTMVIYME